MSDKLNLDEIEARAQEVMAERSIHGGIPRNGSLARMTLLAADVQALLAEVRRLTAEFAMVEAKINSGKWGPRQ